MRLGNHFLFFLSLIQIAFSGAAHAAGEICDWDKPPLNQVALDLEARGADYVFPLLIAEKPHKRYKLYFSHPDLSTEAQFALGVANIINEPNIDYKLRFQGSADYICKDSAMEFVDFDIDYSLDYSTRTRSGEFPVYWFTDMTAPITNGFIDYFRRNSSFKCLCPLRPIE